MAHIDVLRTRSGGWRPWARGGGRAEHGAEHRLARQLERLRAWPVR